MAANPEILSPAGDRERLDMALAYGADAIYLAGRQGVYRHVLGGSAMEQVIDGNLNILGNPAYQIMDMLVADQRRISRGADGRADGTFCL